MKANFVSPAEAADLVKDGATVCTIGMTLVGAAESILKELERRFLAGGSPRELTLLHAGGQCDRERGHSIHCLPPPVTAR